MRNYSMDEINKFGDSVRRLGGSFRIGGGGGGYAGESVMDRSQREHDEYKRAEWISQRTPQSPQAKLESEYQKAYDEAKAANESRYQEMLGITDKTSDQRAADIRKDAASAKAATQQRLTDLGMANTTIAPTMAAGYDRSMQESLDRSADQLQQTRLGIMERRTDAYPDQGMYANMMSQYGQYGQGGGAGGAGGGSYAGDGVQYGVYGAGGYLGGIGDAISLGGQINTPEYSYGRSPAGRRDELPDFRAPGGLVSGMPAQGNLGRVSTKRPQQSSGMTSQDYANTGYMDPSQMMMGGGTVKMRQQQARGLIPKRQVNTMYGSGHRLY